MILYLSVFPIILIINNVNLSLEWRNVFNRLAWCEHPVSKYNSRFTPEEANQAIPVSMCSVNHMLGGGAEM